MVDTNTLLSALVFPKGVTAQAFALVLEEYTLVLCTYVIDEAKEVIRRKFPSYIDKFQSFLNSLTYELVYTPRGMDFDSKLMRDPKDVPILVTAEREDVDCFLTGDKDFLSLDIQRPEFIKASKFIEKYSKTKESRDDYLEKNS